MRKSYAKEFKRGPVFKLSDLGWVGDWELMVFGKDYPPKGELVGWFSKRKYAIMMMKSITLKAREKKKK